MTTKFNSHEPLEIDMAASLATFVVNAAVASLVLSGRLPMTAYLLSHAGCAGLATLIAVHSGATPRRQALLHAMMAASLGPVGSAGTFLCTIFEFCFRPFASPFSEWFESIFPDDERNEDAAFVERLDASEDPVRSSQRITSFMDTLTNGSIEQKQVVLGLIARKFSPAFAPALHQALQDRIPAIRVQAAAAAASIEGKYAQRTFALTRKTAQRTASVEDHRNLANHLVEFAESGIAEVQRSDEARRTALEQYDRVLVLKPGDPHALAASARLLLARGDASQANERIRRAISSSGVTPNLAELHIEALLQLGQFRDLRASASAWIGKLSSFGREGQRLEAAMELWLAGSSRG